MIFECEAERIAFDFICEEASEQFSRRGCNDLDEEVAKKFEGEQVIRGDENGKEFFDDIKYDGDVISWLQSKVREDEKE